MSVKKFESTINVLDAAKIRIKNLFATGCKVYLSFSSGKDSAVLSSLTYDLIMAGEIDRKQLTVLFVDEEGLYKSMVDAAMRWRKRFLSIGVPFLWLCLPFKQVSVLDHLGTWERGSLDPGGATVRNPTASNSQLSRRNELPDLLQEIVCGRRSDDRPSYG